MTATVLVVLAFLIAVNALYVAAEFAAVAVQRPQLAALAKQGNRRAAGLLAVLENGIELDRYIAACQIGITLSSLVAGAYGQATVALALGPKLEIWLEVDAATGHSLAFTIVLLALTGLQVVVGELIPKSLALQFPEQTALVTYIPMRWSVTFYRPFIWLLNGSALVMLKPLRVTPGGHQHAHSLAEIGLLLDQSRRGGKLSEAAHRRLERGLYLSGRTVRQMMTPRQEMVAIEASTPASEVLEQVLKSPYSRVPVYKETLDEVLGAVSAKIVLRTYATKGELPELARLIQPIPFVPESLRAHRLVRFFQEQRASKAIVVNEFGGVQGIISIEDVLIELFGDIGDELKQPELAAVARADGTVRLPGWMGVDEAQGWLGARWQGPAATIAGHIIEQLGRLPNEGESFELDGIRLRIDEMGPTTVRWVIVHPRVGSEPPPVIEEPPVATE